MMRGDGIRDRHAFVPALDAAFHRWLLGRIAERTRSDRAPATPTRAGARSDPPYRELERQLLLSGERAAPHLGSAGCVIASFKRY
jgi:hypothetical protein